METVKEQLNYSTPDNFCLDPKFLKEMESEYYNTDGSHLNASSNTKQTTLSIKDLLLKEPGYEKNKTFIIGSNNEGKENKYVQIKITRIHEINNQIKLMI